jgi:hypothetical protein
MSRGDGDLAVSAKESIVRVKTVCQRRPWGLSRALRKHSSATAIAVYGWFPRIRVYGPVAWASASVSVDGEPRGVVHQTAGRLLWVFVHPGAHTVEVGTPVTPEGHVYDIFLAPGEVVLLAFATPRWTPTGRYRTPLWCPPELVRQQRMDDGRAT